MWTLSSLIIWKWYHSKSCASRLIHIEAIAEIMPWTKIKVDKSLRGLYNTCGVLSSLICLCRFCPAKALVYKDNLLFEGKSCYVAKMQLCVQEVLQCIASITEFISASLCVYAITGVKVMEKLGPCSCSQQYFQWTLHASVSQVFACHVSQNSVLFLLRTRLQCNAELHVHSWRWRLFIIFFSGTSASQCRLLLKKPLKTQLKLTTRAFIC